MVNVIERADERRETLMQAWALARRVLVVSARLVNEAPTRAGRVHEDGVLTRLGTFQKFFEQQELRGWIDATLGETSVAAAPGVFYVFRDRAERAAFLASRYRRRAGPRPSWRRGSAEQHRPLLETLAGFVLERGRLPGDGELPEAKAIASALGVVDS